MEGELTERNDLFRAVTSWGRGGLAPLLICLGTPHPVREHHIATTNNRLL